MPQINSDNRTHYKFDLMLCSYLPLYFTFLSVTFVVRMFQLLRNLYNFTLICLLLYRKKKSPLAVSVFNNKIKYSVKQGYLTITTIIITDSRVNNNCLQSTVDTERTLLLTKEIFLKSGVSHLFFCLIIKSGTKANIFSAELQHPSWNEVS